QAGHCLWANGNLDRFGSWLRENADVLRRRRKAFSRVRCSSSLARGSLLGAHRCRGEEISKNSAVPTLLVRSSRLAFHGAMCRAEGDLEALWNRILTIFDLYTFSRSQGQKHAFARGAWYVRSTPQKRTFVRSGGFVSDAPANKYSG